MSYSRALSNKAFVLPYLEKRLAYIGGQWCKAGDNATFDVKNPANGEILGSVANVGEAEAQDAVLKANKAFHTWKRTTVKVRMANYI
jgi:succinate-semialdehyde dehydrogenase/glutarate-semialdehyde dehydrogenase